MEHLNKLIENDGKDVLWGAERMAAVIKVLVEAMAMIRSEGHYSLDPRQCADEALAQAEAIAVGE